MAEESPNPRVRRRQGRLLVCLAFVLLAGAVAAAFLHWVPAPLRVELTLTDSVAAAALLLYWRQNRR